MDLACAMHGAEGVAWLRAVLVGKARRRPSILEDAGFVQALLREAAQLRGVVERELEKPAIQRRLMRAANVNWRGIPDSQRREILGELRNLLMGLPTKFAPGVTAVLDKETKRIVRDSHRAWGTRYKRFSVDPSFVTKNEQAIEAIKSSTAIAFAPQYERQADRFRERAQRAMAKGLNRGLGSREIGERLAQEFRDTAISRAYWDTVAAVHVNRARSFSAAATYAMNGVTQYEVINPMDERTTTICAMMHGTILSVESSLGLFDRMEDRVKTVEDLQELMPFMRVQGKEIVSQNGDRIARIGRDGNFPGKLSPERMADRGIGMPPYHFRCRSTVLPVL